MAWLEHIVLVNRESGTIRDK